MGIFNDMKRFLNAAFLLSAFILLSFTTKAQVEIGGWVDHLGFNSCVSIAKVGGDFYTSNYSSVLKVNIDDKSTERYSKINKLSDVGINLLRGNDADNTLIICYENGNIDVLQNDNVKNFSDIKRKPINGKKQINDVLFRGGLAYLSSGFGIIVFDYNKQEVKEVYGIGPNGSVLEVYQVCFSDSLVYAATPIGLLKCNYKTKALNNFQNWSLVQGLPAGPYAGVVITNNVVYAGYSPYRINNNTIDKDTLYQFQNNLWNKFPSKAFPYAIKRLLSYGKVFSMIERDIIGGLSLSSYNETQLQLAVINGFPPGVVGANISDAYILDKGNLNYEYWVADLNSGLIKSNGFFVSNEQNKVTVNGLFKNSISNISIKKGKVAVSPVRMDETGGGQYRVDAINVLENKEWKYLVLSGKDADSTNGDLNAVYIDDLDSKRMFVSSWLKGLVEYYDNKVVRYYNRYNSSLPVMPLDPNTHRTSGMDMDKDGNLYVASSDNDKFLSVRRKDGSLVTLDNNNTISVSGGQIKGAFIRRIMVDKNGQCWMLHERGEGITIVKPQNLNSSNPTFRAIRIGKQLNNSNPNSNLGASSYAIVEDKDGKIWVGTNEGISVFSNPQNALSGSYSDGNPIKIVQDGNVELLLEKEIVTALCIDGANNKWVGTLASGVYCFSPDGQKQLFHFTRDESPLFSNQIVDIAYDEKSGDIFIATDLGMQSYRTLIVEGEENYKDIHAYPNPVKPGFAGKVHIRGLVDQSIVKISDESGNFVWETKSTGGQVEWPITNFAGTRVSSGVYIIYAAPANGEIKAVSKIMVVN
jgi:sugar lactone lactonase YvrE